MDLAMHLGVTDAGLRRSMSESDFRRWQQYAAKRMLPMRRLELMLAQLTRLVHVGMAGGDKNTTLADYLFEGSDEEETTGDDISPDDVSEMFGGAVFRKKGDR